MNKERGLGSGVPGKELVSMAKKKRRIRRFLKDMVGSRMRVGGCTGADLIFAGGLWGVVHQHEGNELRF